MEKMIDLRDLLKHEIVDLYSVESQIIEALPDMIDKAINPSLKKALSDHLSVTEKQKERLDKIKGLIIEESQEENKEAPGFFARIFGGGEEKCKGMEGILEEGKKMLRSDMTQEVQDAAIIAACQKVEHYEICGYGTALAYARELLLQEVADLLGQSLDEEYEADDNLTFLAVGHLNLEAEFAGGDMGSDEALKASNNSGSSNGNKRRSVAKKSGAKSNTSQSSSSNGSKNSGSNRTAAKRAPKKSAAPKNSSTKSAPGKGSNRKKGNSGRSNAPAKKSSAPVKTASKGKKAAAASKGRGSNAKGNSNSSRGSATMNSRNAKSAAPKGRGPMKMAAAKKSAPKKSAATKNNAAKKSAAKKGGSKGKRR